MRDHVRQYFRNSAHTLGAGNIKPRDYILEETPVEGSSPYGVWQNLLATERRIDIGDVLESESGRIYLCKYVGFEEARWIVPEAAAPDADGPSPAGEELSRATV